MYEKGNKKQKNKKEVNMKKLLALLVFVGGLLFADPPSPCGGPGDDPPDPTPPPPIPIDVENIVEVIPGE